MATVTRLKATQRDSRGVHGVNITKDLWNEMQAWMDKQLVKPKSQAFLEAAIREFLSNHP